MRAIALTLLVTALSLPAAASDFATGSAACKVYETQRRAEFAALDLLQTAEVRAAADQARVKWRHAVGPVSAEMEKQFQPAFEELVFASAMEAVGQTLDQPVMIRTGSPPHRIGGKAIPGSRFGWDNPDFLYAVIPVQPGGSYVLTGTLPRPEVEINLSAWDPDGTVTFNLSTRDVAIDKSGRFRITVGAAADSQIRLSAKTDRLFIRETLPDWTRDRPVHIAVEQTGGGKRSVVTPAAQIAARSVGARVANMIEWRPFFYTSVPVNSIRQPSFPVGKQGLPNQAYGTGAFALADDEALLMEIGLAGAGYFTMPVSNIWGTTGAYESHVSSVNSAQTIANPDGTLTLIVAPSDPGFANWVSTEGMHEGDLTLRWQGVKQAPGTPQGPYAKARVVKLTELPALLPPAVTRVSATERAAEVKARATYPSRMWVPELPCE